MSITLTHPGKGRQVTVPENVAESYTSQGWVAEEAPTPAEQDSTPNPAWKVEQLKAYAAERGIDLGDATKKADILTVLLAEEDDNADPDDGEADSVPADADGAADAEG